MSAKTTEAPTLDDVPAETDRTPEQWLRHYAAVYGVNGDTMVAVARCESGLDPSVQSFARYKDGTRERSFGLVQIHLPAHPTISYEQAIDPAFAAEFMAKNIKAHPRWWSCWGIVGYPPIV